MQKFDALKIGILLLGIAAIAIAGTITHFYIKQVLLNDNEFKPSAFSAYCSDNTIIITAFQDLQNISVLSKEEKTICSFPKIKKNFDELCNAKQKGIFIIKNNDGKKIVECAERQTPIVKNND